MPSNLPVQLVELLSGPVLTAVKEEGTTDVHINPGGKVFCCTAASGRRPLGSIARSVVARALRMMVDARGGELHKQLLFQGELPGGKPFRGARVQALVPPVVESACLSLRMHSPTVFPLSSFVGSPRLEAPQEGASRREHGVTNLLSAALSRENILISGGTGAGKTSLLNALLASLADRQPSERILVLEDTRELTAQHEDSVSMRTEERHGVTLHALVKASLRMQPDRLVVGEVRGPEALDLVDAWSTGHSGGLATVHANSPRGALERLAHLAQRHQEGGSESSLQRYIGGAVGVVVQMKRGDRHPVVSRVERVLLRDGGYELEPYVGGSKR